MRLVLRIAQAMEALGLRSDRALAQELGIDEGRFREFKSGRFNQISRRHLQILATWAREQKVKSPDVPDIIAWERHPIWETTTQAQPTVIYVESIDSDHKIATQVASLVRQQGGTVADLLQQREEDPDEIVRTMGRTNTIFIGSPRSSRQSEVALSALAGAAPFDSSAENQSRLPLLYAVHPSAKPHTATSCVTLVDNDTDCGLRVGADRRPLRVTYHSDEEEYRQWVGSGIEAGVLVARRTSPDGGPAVTTLVLAGYAGLGTIEVFNELRWDTVDLDEADLASGTVVTRVLRVPFQKTGTNMSRRALRDGRRWFDPDRDQRETDWSKKDLNRGLVRKLGWTKPNTG